MRIAEVRLKEAREQSRSHVANLTDDVAVDVVSRLLSLFQVKRKYAGGDVLFMQFILIG